MRFIHRFALFTTLYLLYATIAVACEKLLVAPVGVDRSTVAFLGKVTDYSTALIPIFSVTSVRGLSVEPMEVISGSVKGLQNVFLFGSAPDCSPIPREVSDLNDQYPIGSIVTVIGSRIAGKQSLPENILVTLADDFGHVARVPSEIPRIKGYLDFKAYRKSFEKQVSSEFSFPIAWRNAHRQWYEDYEFFRCLLAIPRTPREGRVPILEIMASYSRYSNVGVDTAKLVYSALLEKSKISKSDRMSLLLAFDRLRLAR